MKINNRFRFYFLLVGILAFFGLGMYACQESKTSKTGKPLTSPTEGSINFGVDETLRPIFEEQLDVFVHQYPKTNVKISYLPENQLFELFCKDSFEAIAGVRELSKNEADYLDKVKIFPSKYKIGYDAIALICHKENTDTSLKYNQLMDLLSGKIPTWSGINPNRKDSLLLVFDSKDGSNINYINGLVHWKEVPTNFRALKSNEEVIKYVSANKNAIGIIGVNWISNKDETKAMGFLKNITTMGLYPPDSMSESEYYRPLKPYQAYIALKVYPLRREMYIHNREGRMGLATGFSDFVYGKTGQTIIHKSGLLPKNIQERIVKIKKK